MCRRKSVLAVRVLDDLLCCPIRKSRSPTLAADTSRKPIACNESSFWSLLALLRKHLPQRERVAVLLL